MQLERYMIDKTPPSISLFYRKHHIIRHISGVKHPTNERHAQLNKANIELSNNTCMSSVGSRVMRQQSTFGCDCKGELILKTDFTNHAFINAGCLHASIYC